MGWKPQLRPHLRRGGEDQAALGRMVDMHEPAAAVARLKPRLGPPPQAQFVRRHDTYSALPNSSGRSVSMRTRSHASAKA